MTHIEKRKLAELALIYGVPIVTRAKENSRLAGLQRKLQRLVMPDLLTLPGIGEKEAAFIDTRVEAWLKKVGWWQNPTKVSTLISFCLDIIAESPVRYNEMIERTLEKIAEHLENGGQFDYPTMTERDELIETWQQVYK